MSNLSWSDRELADALEGLLDPDVAEALAAEVACDADLAARQSSLAAVLREPVELPRLFVPSRLLPATRQRLLALPSDASLAAALEGGLESSLEGEGAPGLLARDPARARALRSILAEGPESLPALAPPPGLGVKVLAHLEAEGLAPPAPALTVPSDEVLADYWEGTLPPSEAALVERDLGRDPALRARLHALRAVLANEESLAPLDPPRGLEDAVRERLRDEGLERIELQEGASLPVRPPSDLFARTLGRLEAAALVEPGPAEHSATETPAPELDPRAAPPELSNTANAATPSSSADASHAQVRRGVLVTFPRALLAAAALLLIGLGLGSYFAPSALQGGSVDLASHEEARRVRAELEKAKVELRSALQGREDAEAAASRIREAGSRDAQALSEARSELQRAFLAQVEQDRELKAARALETSLRGSLAAARVDAANEKARLARREGALEELRRHLWTTKAALGKAQTALLRSQRVLGESRAARQEAETQRALAQSQAEALANGPRAGTQTRMRVDGATQIERWDADRRAWRSLSADQTLAPGSIVRGVSAESTLQVSGLLPYQLRSGVYVIRDGQRLVPLPEDLHGPGGGPSEPAPDDVLGWIERLQSGSALERSRASQALRAQFRAQSSDGPPPTTAVAWNRWWSQAQRLARR